MRIVGLYIENYKGIKCVNINPDKYVVKISGANEAGKSSLMDAIYEILDHKRISREVEMPVREGEERCYIRLDLGEYIVTRKFNAERQTTSISVETPIGEKVRNPQTILNDMITTLCLDPTTFADNALHRKDDGDRIKTLTTAFRIDLDEFSRRKTKFEGERRDINRERKRLTALRDSIAPPTDDDPRTEVAAGDMLAELDALAKTKATIDESRRVDGRIRKRQQEIAAQMAQLRQESAQLAQQLEEVGRNIPADAGEINDKINELQNGLKDLDTLNKRAREVQQFGQLEKDIGEATKNSTLLTKKLDLVEIEQQEKLESLPLPLPGFKIADNTIFFKEIPYSQLSAAQRLKISLAIAMAANPKLRVIRMTNASLLDSTSRKIVEEMANEHDFQVWQEIVDESGKIGIYLEEGEVKTTNGTSNQVG